MKIYLNEAVKGESSVRRRNKSVSRITDDVHVYTLTENRI